MIKNLIAAAMATTLITAPPQNANDGTYYQDVNVSETYEYETNEVNSVDDLVVGNIYHFDANIQDIVNNNNVTITLTYTNMYNLDTQYMGGTMTYYGYYPTLSFYLSSSSKSFVLGLPISNSTIYVGWSFSISGTMSYQLPVKCDFVYNSGNNLSNIIQYISASDYLGEKTITVEPVETEGLYNLAYHFLYSRIYTNTELQGMETTLFGTTINMNMWLSHTTAIVIICLLLIVLIKFVIWLFKIVSGGMLWQ